MWLRLMVQTCNSTFFHRYGTLMSHVLYKMLLPTVYYMHLCWATCAFSTHLIALFVTDDEDLNPSLCFLSAG